MHSGVSPRGSHLLSALLGFLPQHLFDHRGLPPLVMQGVLQSLSSGLGVGWTADGVAYWAVSDLNMEELESLVGLVQSAG